MTKGGTSDKAIGSLFNPSCNSSRTLLSEVIIRDGSESETKFSTIPSALGRNLSSRSVTTDIADFIGRKTKNPTHAANRKLLSNNKNPAIYLEPNLVLFSRLCISAMRKF